MFTDSGFCWQIEETELLSRKNRRLRTGKQSVVVKLYDVFVVVVVLCTSPFLLRSTLLVFHS